jgi:hypothetical protein
MDAQQQYQAEMFWSLVTAAFSNGELINVPADDSRMGAYVRDGDFVVAVWPEDAGAQRFQFLAVRGTAAFQRGDDVRVRAIPRTDARAALALQAIYGTQEDVESNGFNTGPRSVQ